MGAVLIPQDKHSVSVTVFGVRVYEGGKFGKLPTPRYCVNLSYLIKNSEVSDKELERLFSAQ